VSWLKEFRDFAVKGNVIDLAVGVIIGGAFGKIVSSLVADIVMPLVGAMVGGMDYKELYAEVGGAKVMYGLFIQNCLDFVVIAASIFLAVKLIHHFRRKSEQEPAASPPPRQEKLLEEIRDLLKERRSGP
jgi:large conductance mechanosensitive channel